MNAKNLSVEGFLASYITTKRKHKQKITNLN